MAIIMKNILGNSRWGGGGGGYEKGRYNVLVEDRGYLSFLNKRRREINSLFLFSYNLLYNLYTFLPIPTQPSQRKQKKKYFTFWDYAFIYFIHIKDE